ncbi:BZ3500_MvSof-1268-A1-R1_Chr11-2g03373 [Microbotryum saponariae]|uniref:BZ3500_MvSof-1268-A1-R1_Chr11-2g03373 protein n=1 Tax=Microbotryum saponariae TaxID=289078 RepID=A0A2X0LGT9_9BASI|nr:BZ3500_MvSof-1268-A1-R1_Chr11-2g03373 [Microbotryum saponariae]SDA03224.1 BZ3501_MvSof-1269-A2-R1_Chr11g02944 [Microbotryum saponariae]
MKLLVMIGPNRFDMEVAHVNDQSRPTEIDTELFAGRVVVFVKDFVGVAPPGCQPIKEHPYFTGRSRKYAILIEGRFKQRPGVAPYSGSEVQFGSDFVVFQVIAPIATYSSYRLQTDFLPESFPQGPFSLGLKVAQRVDPATSAVMKPSNGRPYIMSPYLACMNTFAAYPAPNALSKALVQALHDADHPHNDHETESATFVPREEVDSDSHGVMKTTRHGMPYWRFVGLRGDPAVEEYVEKHRHLLAPDDPMDVHGSALALGTSISHLDSSSSPKRHPSRVRQESPDGPSGPQGWGAPIPMSDGEETREPAKKKKGGRFSWAGFLGSVEKESNETYLHAGDLVMADKLNKGSMGDASLTGVSKHLGPWRFADPKVDAIEDSLFIFHDSTHERSVAERRKWFVQNHGYNRDQFTYSPDVVYTASFFTSFCDLNTFDLKMGPLGLNIAPYFAEQPIRYTLRSTRLAPRPDGKPGPDEEEVFCTISFQLSNQ